MSLRAHRYVSAVLDDGPHLNVTARLLLRELADYANDDGEAWPAVETLARRMGITAANVRRARARLVAAGIIALTPSTGGRPTDTTTVRFPVHAFVSPSTPRAVARGVETRDPARYRAQPRAVARVTPRGTARRSINEPLYEPRGDDTPAAFTNADGARVWARARAGFVR